MAFMTAVPLVRSSVRLSSAVTARRSFAGARVVATRPATVRVVAANRAASSAAPVRMDMESDLRDRLDELFKEKNCMPIMVRLAWHDAGTYDKESKTGGPCGSIRFEPEIKHAANAGLTIAMDMLEPIKKDFPDVSYADLYQLASVQAIAFAGGPKIPFRFGRKDSLKDAVPTPADRLPDADQRMSHLRDIFYRMGMDDSEIVALSGAHTLGRAHPERSGKDGPWTKVPIVFDNTYFVEILKEKPDPALLRLESDLALLDEPETKSLVEKYAADQDAFFADYAKAHAKLSELGVSFS
ncbi:hypothetical protein MMPV_003780 [Pyropia vietnamensis]